MGNLCTSTEIQSFSRDTWRREQSCVCVRNDSEACNMKCQRQPLMFISLGGCCDIRVSSVHSQINMCWRTSSSFLIMPNISNFSKLTRHLNKTCRLTCVELITQQTVNTSVSRVIIRAAAPLWCEMKYVLCIRLSVDCVALAGLFQRWRPVEDSPAELFISDQRSVHTDQPCSDSADPQRRLFWDQSRTRHPGFTQHCREWVTCSYAVNALIWCIITYIIISLSYELNYYTDKKNVYPEYTLWIKVYIKSFNVNVKI